MPLKISVFGKVHNLEQVRRPTNKSMFRVSGRKLIKTLYHFVMTLFFRVFVVFYATFLCENSYAQFPGPAGTNGTSAMYKDSSAFIAWANQCHITRGLQDISTPANGYATVGDSSSAIGAAGANGVVSLGDGGIAILQFNTPISDGIGNDFAVFENSFSDYFLELAFVEVSSDGINYVRFPAISNFDTSIQVGPFDNNDPTKINNLAGKYRANYGTPFDLSVISNNTSLNKNAITHIKIIDVVGSIQNQYATRDINFHKINDPWPTPYNSCGFDLDAVGVIHNQSNTVGLNETNFITCGIYPNPTTGSVFYDLRADDSYSYTISDVTGRILETGTINSASNQLNLSTFKNGIYLVSIKNNTYIQNDRIILQ